MCAATKTMVKLFRLTDCKRGGFLIMKRAARNIISACFLKWYMAVNRIDNIGTIKQVMNKGLWNHLSRNNTSRK